MTTITFKASQVHVTGRVSTVDHLGNSELDGWMEWAYGKFATVKIEASNGAVVTYTDNGEEWVKVPNG